MIHFSATRFVKSSIAIVTFEDLLLHVLSALSRIKSWSSSDVSNQAHALQCTICSFEFIAIFLVLEMLSGLMLPILCALPIIIEDDIT